MNLLSYPHNWCAHFAINNLSFKSSLAGDAIPTGGAWWRTPCLICLLHHSLCSEGLSALGRLLFLLHCNGSPDPSGFCIYFKRTSWEFVRSSLHPPISHGSFPLGVNQPVLVASPGTFLEAVFHLPRYLYKSLSTSPLDSGALLFPLPLCLSLTASSVL